MTQPRRLILILGVSGSGKGTMIGMLRERHPEFVYPLSLTTRPMREGEQDGQVYHFTSKEDFERAIAAGELLEYALVHQQQYSGLLKGPVMEALQAGKTVVREIDIQGLESIKATELAAQVLSIFLLPPSLDLIKDRILKRSALTEEEVQRRLHTAIGEVEHANLCDVQILAEENQQEKIYAQMEAAILAAGAGE